MSEYVILVDENDIEIGRAEKIDAHRRGLLHRAFSVILMRGLMRGPMRGPMRGDEIMLQRRALGKYHSGGLWANAACGHPRPGETLLDGATRRLREEMGIDCALSWRASTHYSCALNGAMSENEIVHLFFGEYDGPVAPDPAEVMDWAWRGLEAFRAEAAASADYTYWIKTYVERGLV